jgi:hypothetical protein
MHEELLAELEGTSSDAGEPAELIERAIAAQEQLQGIVTKQLLRLRVERGRFDRKKPAAMLIAGGRAAP